MDIDQVAKEFHESHTNGIRPALVPFLLSPLAHSEGASMFGVPLDHMTKDELQACCIVLSCEMRKASEKAQTAERARERAEKRAKPRILLG